MSQKNNIGLLRLTLACMVLAAHSFGRTGNIDPLWSLSGHQISLGSLAVAMFFALSGFLLTKSIEREPDLRLFTVRRLARIYPAALGVGLIFSAAAMIGAGRAAMPSLLTFDYDYLPFQAFGSRNVPLWTVRYELLCYVGLIVLWTVGVYRNRWAVLVGALALPLLFRQAGAFHGTFGMGTLAGCFMAGSAIYLFGRKADWRVAAAGVAVLVGSGLSGVLTPLCALPLAYLAFALAYGTKPVEVRWDLSYGVYLIGWPIQNWLGERFTLSPAVHLLISLAVVIPLAVPCWLLVERPAQEWAKRYRFGRRTEPCPPLAPEPAPQALPAQA